MWERLAPESRQRIQRLLCVQHTGCFDTNTQRNLRLWQQMVGIPATGLVDQWTYERMQTYMRSLSLTHHRVTNRGLWWDIDPIQTLSSAHHFADHLVLMGIDQVSIRIDHETNLDDPGPLWTWSPRQLAHFALILDRRDIGVAISLTPLPALVHLKHLIDGILERSSHLVSTIDMRFTPATLEMWRDPVGCGFESTNEAASALVDRLPALPLHVTYTAEPLSDPPEFWDVAEEVKYLVADTSAVQLQDAIANDEFPVWISPASALFDQCDNHQPELEALLKSSTRHLLH